MLNPVHLRTLTTVVRTGSFADAARQLGYSGSAVSQQVAALERAVRMPLFERDAHSVRPTSAGEFIAERARDVLAALSALEDDIRGMAEGSIGRLRLGSFPTASENLLPLVLATYAGEHPQLEIMLDEGEPDQLVPLLQAAELDLALVYRYSLVPQHWPKTLKAVNLLDEELLLLLAKDHHLADASGIVLADLKAETWISTCEGTAGASCLRRICAGAGFAPRIGYRSNDYDVIANFVKSGLGIALVPVLGHVPDDEVFAVRIEDVQVRRQVVVALRSTKANPAVAGVVSALQASARTLAGRRPGISAAVTR
ncbi:LysR family transcriptional regulator [Dactylosporangium roseum]|uniref:LysR family transcriptional regulator n=1 Tax=Dactylosporangium roseum TaxID=47989 RepID=A0ABY5ZEY5_9ACTN|nr:LysR family transcriptional regulator [Dactylosporangium roseum]UWZ39213.1 LysR family transcriptional regulator [Dactylosporangium roseum]